MSTVMRGRYETAHQEPGNSTLDELLMPEMPAAPRSADEKALILARLTLELAALNEEERRSK